MQLIVYRGATAHFARSHLEGPVGGGAYKRTGRRGGDQSKHIYFLRECSYQGRVRNRCWSMGCPTDFHNFSEASVIESRK